MAASDAENSQPADASIPHACSALRGLHELPDTDPPDEVAFSDRFIARLRAPYPRTACPETPARHNGALQQTDTLLGLMGALYAYDPHTSRHSMKVETLANRLAERIGIGAADRGTIRMAAMLHDIGKICVPIGILAKPAKLTTNEFEIVKRHPTIGANMIEPIPLLNSASVLVRHHHEWFNGSGYQQGLRGTAIPLGARIIQAADCIDAMMSPRSYKEAYNTSRVIDELRLGRGTQFDPDIADIAVACLEETSSVSPPT